MSVSAADKLIITGMSSFVTIFAILARTGLFPPPASCSPETNTFNFAVVVAIPSVDEIVIVEAPENPVAGVMVKLSFAIDVATLAVSYTHLTLPTKRIV